MNASLVRTVSVSLLLLSLAACAGLNATPATAPSTDVNPITGSRGGGGGR